MATYDLTATELYSALTHVDPDTKLAILDALEDKFDPELGNGPYHVQIFDGANVSAVADGNTQGIFVNSAQDVHLDVSGPNDVVIGTGTGNDAIQVDGPGHDSVFSGTGNDFLFHSGTGPSELYGMEGDDTLFAGVNTSHDTLV